jgi:hypothetical protein
LDDPFEVILIVLIYLILKLAIGAPDGSVAFRQLLSP